VNNRKLKFLKFEDGGIAAVIKESHSVEVLGCNDEEQFGNIVNNTILFKCLAPSRLKSAEVLGAKNGGYSSIGNAKTVSVHAVKAHRGRGEWKYSSTNS
jgi:hypothetical protein